MCGCGPWYIFDLSLSVWVQDAAEPRGRGGEAGEGARGEGPLPPQTAARPAGGLQQGGYNFLRRYSVGEPPLSRAVRTSEVPEPIPAKWGRLQAK